MMSTHFVCLTVGINLYPDHKGLPILATAVTDANNVDNYLQTELNIPKENILSLRDQTATRKGIFDGLEWLVNQVEARAGNVYVIIFFTGHAVWDGMASGNSMLCPSDFGKEVMIEGDCTKTIDGISDSILSEWLRKFGAVGVLKTHLPLCIDCDFGLLLSLTTGLTVRPRIRQVFAEASLSRRSQRSYENPEEGGLFVNRFLSVLRQENFKTFTDVSLMHRLSVPTEPEFPQTPHCISNRIYGTLFIGRGDEGDTSFVVTAMEEGQCWIVRAGSAAGIRACSVWSMHRTNLADSQENPEFGRLTVIQVDLFSSTVNLIPPLPSAISFTANSILYSKLVRNTDSSEPISVYSSDKAWLELVIPPAVQTELSIRIVDDIEESDLALWVDQGKVRFQRRKKLQTSYREPVMRGSVNAENVSAIRNVVKASIFFDYHLKRNSQREFKGVRMELKEVDEEELEEGNLCPKENVLSDEWSATVHDCEQKRFVVTLHNETNIPFYPYLFYFDPDKLTITSLYSPPVGGGKDGFTSLVDVPLTPKKQLNIGNINADDGLLAFDVAKGEDAEVGYL
ncbi:hypothetical protein D9613_009133 [Agrocybe pediades]|uniref:Peptidase C14 caspase domain-containing protein n=1 Tax=Agrocybe pediades TaxID=84607 RepID=A0A8H4VTL2_9AGAR|nr:hypothetical protein D9613_009133 [Agrocybe pediades]